MISWCSFRKSIVFLLFIFSLSLFVYVRREIILGQAQKLIIQNLEKNLAYKFSIGKVKAGLLYGLILEDLEIDFPANNFGLAMDIKVEQAYVDYNLWKIALTGRSDKQKELRILKLIAPDIKISYQKPSSAALAQMQPKFDLEDFILVLVNGRMSFNNFPFNLSNLEGKVLLTKSGFYFRDIRAAVQGDAENVLRFYGDLQDERFSLTANLDHFKIKNFDILTNLTLTLNTKLDPEQQIEKLSGTLRTFGSVLNNRPFPELGSSFEIHNDKLRILTCSLGDNYDLRGIVALWEPFSADLSLNFYQAALHELVAQFIYPEQPDFSGLTNGLVKITGELPRPKIDGYLEIKNGHLGDLNFVSADINLKGQYPILLIKDSRILREDDSFLMEGEFDLANLEQRDSLELQFSADKSILWQGWDVTRPDEHQVHMSKSISDDFKVTFDAFMEDERAAYRDEGYANELGLEYSIFADHLIKLRLRKEEEILGVERRIRF